MTPLEDVMLRGVRDVDALVFSGGHAWEDAVLHWDANAQLLRLGADALVVRLGTPRPRRCEIGRGYPLVAREGRLVGFPISDEALAGTPAGAVVRFSHGRLLVEQPTAAEPADLFDLSGWHVVEPIVALPDPRDQVTSAPHPPAAEPSLIIEPMAFDIRSRLGDHPPPTIRDRRQWQRLQRRQPDGAPGSSGTDRSRSSIMDWLHHRRHQRYLDELTRLFAAGDLEAALRRAIPFGGPGGAMATGTPRPRDDLAITPRRQPGSVLPLDEGLRAELEHRYRAAFARLEAEGRILDAAFVLADLLDRVADACSFLERHGELRLAAELAEARSSDHGEIVRLWWRAGERDRAVAIARRHGCFAPAIARLERTGNSEEADGLRRTWMSHLLDAGDIVGAYDVGTALEGEEAAALRSRLIDLGVERGGPLQPRMLARQLRAHDEDPHPALDRLLSTLSGRRGRELLAEELTKDRGPVDHPHVVRKLLRRLLTEEGQIDRKVIAPLIALAEDPILGTDLPRLALLERGATATLEPIWIEMDPADRGQVPVSDARLLADGRLIVALADLGVRVMKPSGRVEAEIDVPAHELVISDTGLRVLALRVLDPGVIGVAAIAVPERRTRHLGEIAATAWAPTFDGAQWFLANQSQLWMLDMLADVPAALWRQSDHREPIIAISRSLTRMAVASMAAFATPDGPRSAPVVRRYTLPGLVELGLRQQEWLGPASSLLADGEVVAGDVADEVYRCRIERGDTTLTVVATKVGAEAPVAVIQMGGSSRTRLRLDNGSLVVADELGRVEVVDLETGVRRSHRVTV